MNIDIVRVNKALRDIKERTLKIWEIFKKYSDLSDEIERFIEEKKQS